jgi:hypothetical protein
MSGCFCAANCMVRGICGQNLCVDLPAYHALVLRLMGRA